MINVFHAWPFGRFIETSSNLKRKKLHRMKQGFNFLGGSSSNRYNVRTTIQFRRESQPQHLYPSDPSILTSVATVLLGWSNKTSWNQPVTSCPSWKFLIGQDSSSEDNFNCCHRSDAWSYLEYRVVSSA